MEKEARISKPVWDRVAKAVGVVESSAADLSPSAGRRILGTGGRGSGGDILVKITAKAGTTVPFLYCGVECEMTGTSWLPASFTAKSGGLTYSWTLANAPEVGGYSGPPLNVGDVVLVKDLGAKGGIAFMNMQRGTYP